MPYKYIIYILYTYKERWNCKILIRRLFQKDNIFNYIHIYDAYIVYHSFFVVNNFSLKKKQLVTKMANENWGTIIKRKEKNKNYFFWKL